LKPATYLRQIKMILPNKYINLSESLLGFSAYVTFILDTPKTLDEIWNSYQEHIKIGNYPANNNFNELILCIDLLYLFGLLEIIEENKIELSTKSP